MGLRVSAFRAQGMRLSFTKLNTLWKAVTRILKTRRALVVGDGFPHS